MEKLISSLVNLIFSLLKMILNLSFYIWEHPFKILKFIGITLGIVSLIVIVIILVIFFINDELPKWVSYLVFGICIYAFLRWIIQDAVKNAIDESTNLIIDKLDEISDKLSSEELLDDSPVERQIGIIPELESLRSSIEADNDEIKEHLKAIREIIKNR